ncbi:DEAD/DEAH box helicase [uncultured Draconibacterium sp.]|uniref:DEAD/DEAH box helicase n=1 Tax=uncultured Draconibacterium sp. TaxID=1573823 RepID=UPI0032164853
MEIQQLSLREFRKSLPSSFFEEAFTKLQLNLELEESELQNLLKNAILFTNFGDKNIQKLGYKIIVSYSNKYENYKPLYDFAINKGYIPISKFIEQKHTNNSDFNDHFFNLFFSSFHENFKEKNYYISNGQKKLIEFSSNTNSNFVLVAPTSYGKSEIILDKVYSNLDKKVCIIVPSKALLAQTKKRLLNDTAEHDLNRIITHPEMYKGTEQNFVAVLTQERLLRLLQKNPLLKIDLLLVDEAHNLFGEKKNDGRAILLAQTIIILKSRNQNIVLNFFSPFISNPENVKVRQSGYEINSQTTDEFIKSEKYYICDLYDSPGELKLYEQFSDSLISTQSTFLDYFDLLNSKKARKNIVYLNRPKHIEEFSIEYSSSLPNVETPLTEIVSSITDFLHPEYNLIKCIKKGIVYHHGGMPEIIRLYVENIFSKFNDLRFVITSSTLLEGVNIPAEKIFLLSTKKGRGNLSVSHFKNLIGRINRFSEIFNPETGSLRLLEPEIFVIKSKYENKRANIETFIKTRAKTEITILDEVNNLLLKDEDSLDESDKNELKKSLEYLENIEPNTTDLSDVDYVQSELAKLCFKNNVYDFDIKENESQLNDNLSNYEGTLFPKISDSNHLLDAINLIFFNEIEITDNNIKRLQNSASRRFYSMILEWRSSSASYKEMIGSFMRYWSTLQGSNLFVYIGEKWGEEKRNYTDIKPLYVDLRKKNNSQRINLAILKIKEEQDFVEFNLLKYIDILAELELIESDFYDKIKYGSSDKRIITLLKNGFSIELAKCITKPEYSNFISINPELDEITLQNQLITEMEIKGENKILLFEIKFHLNEN